jgi:hypothetical protein
MSKRFFYNSLAFLFLILFYTVFFSTSAHALTVEDVMVFDESLQTIVSVFLGGVCGWVCVEGWTI